MAPQTVYEFELWSSSGVRLADISRLATNRSYTLQRNKEEILTFTMNVTAFQEFCASIGADPKALLAAYQMDVKVKRNGVYLFGTQIVSSPVDLSDTSDSVNVTAHGYLNLFKDRYITTTYSSNDATYIAGNLLTLTQAQTNGSVGVTLAAGQYSTGVLRDRTYSRDNVKTALQALTEPVDGRFDFGFTYDKQFQTYSQAGSVRTDVSFVYGGAGSNVKRFYTERSALGSLYNRIIGLGSGFGPDQLISIQDNVTSQVANYMRETIKQYNSVILQATLDQNAGADLAMAKDLLEVPVVTITGKELPNTFLSVGDRIPVKTVGYPLVDIDGIYRIEKMVVEIDDNDFESSIMLYFDNYAVGL